MEEQWIDRQTDRKMGGWMDRWMDGCRAQAAWCHLSPSAHHTSKQCPTTPMCCQCSYQQSLITGSSALPPPSLGGYSGTGGLVAPLDDAWAVQGLLL